MKNWLKNNWSFLLGLVFGACIGFMLLSCGNPPPKSLGCCLSLTQPLYCIDFADTTTAQVLDADSTRYVCDVYGAVYGDKTCKTTVTNTESGECALPVKDGVEQTYHFYGVTTVSVQSVCTQVGGSFGQ